MSRSLTLPGFPILGASPVTSGPHDAGRETTSRPASGGG
jgi:hypothetical protein